jgi:hypothetical protein
VCARSGVVLRPPARYEVIAGVDFGRAHPTAAQGATVDRILRPVILPRRPP